MIVIDMDLPSSCYRCPLYDSNLKECKKSGSCDEYINGRQKNCPIIADTEDREINVSRV